MVWKIKSGCGNAISDLKEKMIVIKRIKPGGAGAPAGDVNMGIFFSACTLHAYIQRYLCEILRFL